MKETKNRLPGFPLFFISPVRWSTGRLLISKVRALRDNTKLSVANKSIETEYLIAYILRKDGDDSQF